MVRSPLWQALDAVGDDAPHAALAGGDVGMEAGITRAQRGALAGVDELAAHVLALGLGDNDVAMLGADGLVHDEQIAVSDAQLTHGVAACAPVEGGLGVADELFSDVDALGAQILSRGGEARAHGAQLRDQQGAGADKAHGAVQVGSGVGHSVYCIFLQCTGILIPASCQSLLSRRAEGGLSHRVGAARALAATAKVRAKNCEKKCAKNNARTLLTKVISTTYAHFNIRK